MKKTLLLVVALGVNVILFGQIKVISNNNVGIHTDNPLSKVSLGNNGYSYAYMNIFNNITQDYSRGLYIRTESTASHKYTLVGSTQVLGGDWNYSVQGYASASTSTSGRAYGIYGQAGNASNGYNYGVYGRLVGTNDGAAVFGTVDFDYDVPGKYAGFFYGNVKIQGSLIVSGTITESDINLKKDIKNLEKGSIGKLMQVQALKYKLKNPKERAEEVGTPIGSDTAVVINLTPEIEAEYSRERIGLSAQDLQQVYPELVVEGQDGSLGVDYVGLIPVLIEALKEQQEVLDNQATTLIEQANLLDSQSKEIESLKKLIIKEEIIPAN